MQSLKKRNEKCWSYRLHKLGTPLAFQMEKTIKMSKYLSNVHKMVGAHLQCVNNHYAKFEY